MLYVNMYMYDSIALNSWNEKYFRQIYRENQNTQFVLNNIFPKIVPFWDNLEKYGRARQATDDNIMLRRKDAISMPDN
jgi:hypothetical protein